MHWHCKIFWLLPNLLGGLVQNQGIWVGASLGKSKFSFWSLSLPHLFCPKVMFQCFLLVCWLQFQLLPYLILCVQQTHSAFVWGHTFSQFEFTNMSFVFLLGWVKPFVHDKIRPLIIETILKQPENLVQSTYSLGKKLVGFCQFSTCNLQEKTDPA